MMKHESKTHTHKTSDQPVANQNFNILLTEGNLACMLLYLA